MNSCEEYILFRVQNATKAKPITQPELLTGVITSTRQVRQIIHDLRVTHGKPIVSDRRGYWIAESKEDIDAYLNRKVREVRATVAAMWKTHRAMRTHGTNKQLDFFDEVKSGITAE